MSAESLFRHMAAQLRRLRGTWLVLVALPLMPALIFSLVGGQQRPMLGLLAGLALLALALLRLRRGRLRSASVLVGLATAVIAATAGGIVPLGAAVFGLMAFFGTALFYKEAPPAVTEPVPPPAPDPLDRPRERILALEGADARLRPALLALRALVSEMALRPMGVSEARRFLNLQLDGLERIESRLRLGAEPPESLPRLIDDMARGSFTLRDRLRAAESEALEIQVKVLNDRLREEGYA